MSSWHDRDERIFTGDMFFCVVGILFPAIAYFTLMEKIGKELLPIERIIFFGLIIAAGSILNCIGLVRMQIIRGMFGSGAAFIVTSAANILIASILPYSSSLIVSDFTRIFLLPGKFTPMTVKEYMGGVVLLEHSPLGGEDVELQRYLKAHPETKAVALNSLGGSAEAALRIARVVEERYLTTIVMDGSLCNSACSYIFVSGKERILSSRSFIGFHQAADLEGNPAPANFQNLYDSYLEARGVASEAIAVGRKTPKDKLHKISGDDALKLGVANKIGGLDQITGIRPW